MKSNQSPLTPDQLSTSFAVQLDDSLRRVSNIQEALQEAAQRCGTRIEERSYGFFIEALQLITEGAKQRMLDLRHDFEVRDSEDEARFGSWDGLASVASGLDEYIERYVQQLFRERPAELEVFALPFTRLAKRLVPNIEPLFFTWNVENYAAESYDHAFVGAFDSLPAKNLRLKYGRDIKFVQLLHPALRERDIFHHAIFAHELGHIVLRMPRDAWSYSVEGDDRPEIEAVDPPPEDPESRSFEDVVTTEVPLPDGIGTEDGLRLANWFVECACDVFAVRLLGPAFALAYAEATASGRRLEPSGKGGKEDHPPAEIRFAVLAEEVRRFHLGDKEESVRPILDAYMASYLPDQAPDGLETQQEWLDRALKRFRELLPEILRSEEDINLEYKPVRLREDLPVILAAAERRVPPSERINALEADEALDAYTGLAADAKKRTELPWSEPIDWRSILNGLLLWHLERHGPPSTDDGSREERRRDRELAETLACGAIELSEFHFRSRKLRNEVSRMLPVRGDATL